MTTSGHTTRPKTLWCRVAQRFVPHRAALLASLVIVLVSVALNSVGPLLLQRVLNDALPHHHVRELSMLCAAMLFSAVLAGLLGLWQGMLANRIGQSVVHQLRVAVFDHVQAMPLDFFAGDANTEIQARLVSGIGTLKGSTWRIGVPRVMLWRQVGSVRVISGRKAFGPPCSSHRPRSS